MTKYKWIEDDNADNINTMFYEYEYNKDNPGVYIEILKENSLKDNERSGNTKKIETSSSNSKTKRSRSK